MEILNITDVYNNKNNAIATIDDENDNNNVIPQSMFLPIPGIVLFLFLL